MSREHVRAIKSATKGVEQAEHAVKDARSVLHDALVNARAHSGMTDEEISQVWGKSRQALHKFIGPEKARVKI